VQYARFNIRKDGKYPNDSGSSVKARQSAASSVVKCFSPPNVIGSDVSCVQPRTHNDFSMVRLPSESGSDDRPLQSCNMSVSNSVNMPIVGGITANVWQFSHINAVNDALIVAGSVCSALQLLRSYVANNVSFDIAAGNADNAVHRASTSLFSIGNSVIDSGSVVSPVQPSRSRVVSFVRRPNTSGSDVNAKHIESLSLQSESS
jgi:hypothetical protein